MRKELVLKFNRKEKFKEISLLFYAMNIPFEVKSKDNMRLIIVPEKERRNALFQIYCYRRENLLTFKDLDSDVEEMDYFSYYSIVFVFFCFYIFQMFGIKISSLNLIEKGALSVIGIKNGEWYRVVTALTLHSDFLHILSNAFFGGLITYFVLKRVGRGIGWFLILLSGIAGNTISVFIHSESYVSIGSSTACFGSLGILTIERILYSDKTILKIKNSIFLPFASSLAFLGLFGASPDSDIFAHLFGYISGLLIGFLYLFLNKKIQLNVRLVNILAGCLTISVIIISWLMAIIIIKTDK